MTRPPVMRGAFSVGLSVAVLKGVKKTVRKHLERRGWLEPHKVDYELVFTIDRLKNLVDEKHDSVLAVGQHDAGELSWRKVFNFISRQSSELDTRIYIFILLLCLVVPVVWTVLDGDHDNSLDDNDDYEDARRLKHYGDGERAVLQFGKNRSEPIILSYKDMDVPEGEREFTAKRDHNSRSLTSKSENALDGLNNEDTLSDQPEEQVEVDIGCDENELGEETNTNDIDDQEKDCCSSPEVEPHDEFNEDNPTEPEFLTRDTKTTSSLKSSTSFPLSFKGSIDLRSINQPSSLLHIQVSPTKSTNLDAQVNTEQAYSQPFRY
ncbi:Nvj1p [Saccharomyces eubayanus]|uniref:Nvj1p n=1 Tax=Saccharomyces eubayanus TaxID=1080349 RepID=UPI0006BEF8E2|nr:NVJ1-like protein [Saccharomyces eubayanus]KOG99253.1 NVJ1-like protein [Saccharomyces eubayanus]